MKRAKLVLCILFGLNVIAAAAHADELESQLASSVSIAAAQGLEADLSDSALVQAAKAEIAYSESIGNKDTACSDFVAKALRRAGVAVPGFMANEFRAVVSRYLPDWRSNEFSTQDLAKGREDLRAYLNSLPNHTGLLAQWTRTGPHGHVAILEKVGTDQFLIYQAQLGLSVPGMKPVKIEGLLYGALGADRSHLYIYSEN